MSLFSDDYHVNDTDVDEWLPWGGITHPFVLQQKGGSFFSVIKYSKYSIDALHKAVDFPKFRRGWVIWSEVQNGGEGELNNYLVVFWNPFINGMSVENDLGNKVHISRTKDYFVAVMEYILSAFKKVTDAKLIEYQELVNFLYFSLTLNKCEIEMPNPPLYLDVLLSQDETFKFLPNGININGSDVFILTILDLRNNDIYYDFFKSIPFRHVRRLILVNEEEAETELKQYLGKWCPGRKVMREYLRQDILSDVNGYYHECFVFMLPPNDVESFTDLVNDELERRQIIYKIESYNLKDIWWGTLPGLFLANIVPPIMGFKSIENLLHNEIITYQQQKTAIFDNVIKSLSSEENSRENMTLETNATLEKKSKGLEYV